jgi:hypothetical protein
MEPATTAKLFCPVGFLTYFTMVSQVKIVNIYNKLLC